MISPLSAIVPVIIAANEYENDQSSQLPKCRNCGKFMNKWITVGGIKSSYGALVPDDPMEVCLACARLLGESPND